MEQQGVFLRGIARVLNAAGSALLNVYDAASSIKTVILPGEQRNLSVQIREYEKKIERLYFEIGKEVVLREDRVHMSAAGEAEIKRIAEYQVEIEKIRQRIKEMGERKKAAQEETKDSSAARAEQGSGAGEPAASEAQDASDVSVSADIVMEEVKERVADAAETQAQELRQGTSEAEAEVAGEISLDAETEEEATTVVLETLLKSDLLKICSEKGISADKRMTKAEMIELISGRLG